MTAEQYKGTDSRRGAIAVNAGENISLKEALGQWTVTELRSLASAYSVKNPSKLRKEPLIDAVPSSIFIPFYAYAMLTCPAADTIFIFSVSSHP